MPTTGELQDLSSNIEALKLNFQEPCHSWTDDLPVCPLSGVGFSTNQKYRNDGNRREEHAFEDRSFHFKYDDDTYFYGVFDGHIGTRAADFAAQRMPAEILLGQLKGKETDREIREVLQQAFLAVEKSFFQSIDDLLAEKENLRLQLQGLRTLEAIKQYPDIVQRLKSVTEQIQSGTTAVVALIHKNKLYVANVGDCRAILCQEDKNGKANIYQLSSDHIFNNEDEILRLTELGVDSETLVQKSKRGVQNYTRCIGNYSLKGGYKEFDNLSEAQEEPIIAEPTIVGGIDIDDRCKFLLLMSDGLYKSLEEAIGIENANAFIANMLLKQFAKQSTLTSVTQAVVDEVVRIHNDAFMQNEGKRDDITLLVRNFNCPISKQTGHFSQSNTLSGISSIDASYGQNTFNYAERKEDSSTSSSESAKPQTLFQPQDVGDVSLDDEGRIKPYVDFSDFYAAIEEAHKEGNIPADWLLRKN